MTNMKRHYISVLERRMPWSLFPVPEQLSFEQKVRILTTYRQIQNICKYQEAKMSLTFAEWNGTYTIPLTNEKITDLKGNVRQSRSGRLLKSKPQYIDDGSDSDASCSRKKTKKVRKLSNDGFSCTKLGSDKNFEGTTNKYEKQMKSNTYNRIVNEAKMNEMNTIYPKINFESNILKSSDDVLEISSDPIILDHNDIENKKIQNDTIKAKYKKKALRNTSESMESQK